MSYAEVRDSVKAGQNIVIGIVVIAVTVAIGIFVVNSLNDASNGTLTTAVQLVQSAITPIGGGLQFLGLAFLVMVAAVIIKILQGLGGGGGGA